MKTCPFCGSRLFFDEVSVMDDRVKITFTCDNTDCDEGEDKIFFINIYPDDVDLEY